MMNSTNETKVVAYLTKRLPSLYFFTFIERSRIMRNLVLGGLAVAGGIFLTRAAADYVLTKYKKEIREYVIEKVVNYFFTDEDGEEIDDSELIMTAAKAYLKQKGAK